MEEIWKDTEMGAQTGVSHVLRGRHETHKGWSFKYASNIEK